MSTNSAHNGHGLFWRWFHRDRHQESGWQRERQTGDVPAIQMDATPAVHYPLHQDEVHVFDPSRLLDHPVWLNWLVAQPETRPRYADEKTGPKSRQQLDGHLQQINPQYAPYQPPQCTPREGMQRVAAPHTPVPDVVADTLAPLPGLPRWLVGATPAGDLPVERQQTASVAPEQSDGTQMTLPWSNHAQQSRPLNVLELPPHIAAMVQAQIAKHNSQPLDEHGAYPDIPTVVSSVAKARRVVESLPVVEDFAEQSWLLRAPHMLTHEPEEPALLPTLEIDHNALAASDKSNVFAVTPEDCDPDLTDEEGTMAQANPALYQMRLLARKEHEQG